MKYFIHAAALIFLCSSCTVNAFDIFNSLKDMAKRFSRGTIGIFTDVECMEWFNKPNITDLKYQLETRLYGQHIVIKAVVRSIEGHLKYDSPSKALVLSFHGSTGCGKNYVSRIIAECLYPSGMDSKHVHLIHCPSAFPHENQVPLYKDQLKAWIRGNTSNCERNLFIFDEIEKMPPGLINIIKPFLDHYLQIEGIDYKKNIFLLLSNTGGREITNYTLNMWKKGKTRNDISFKELEEILTGIAFNKEGGLWHSNLIDHNLISAFIPFLPLERQHIKMCIEDDLRKKHLSVKQELVEKIADELKYIPGDVKLYSATGCKRVSDKVNMNIEHDEL